MFWKWAFHTKTHFDCNPWQTNRHSSVRASTVEDAHTHTHTETATSFQFSFLPRLFSVLFSHPFIHIDPCNYLSSFLCFASVFNFLGSNNKCQFWRSHSIVSMSLLGRRNFHFNLKASRYFNCNCFQFSIHLNDSYAEWNCKNCTKRMGKSCINIIE